MGGERARLPELAVVRVVHAAEGKGEEVRGLGEVGGNACEERQGEGERTSS